MGTSKTPPGPGFWQGLATGRNFRRDALGLLRKWHRDYGDIVYLGVGTLRFYWLFHPGLAREVLITQARRFRRAGRQVEVLREWDGDGLVTSDGDFWLRQRRLVQPAFNAGRFPGYARQMTAAASRLVDRWLKEQPASIEMNTAMTDLTLEIMADTFFGADLSSETRRLGEAVAVLSEYAVRELGKPFSLPNWVPLPGIRRKLRAIRFLNETIDRLIRERRASKEDRGDLLSMLLHATDDEGDGRGMTDEQVRHEAMTLFLAGHDTTAGVLPWVWYLLARHPQAEARLVEEVDRVLHGRTPTADDLPRLAYAQMVVKETLRLYPQAYVLFARVAAEDVELGGYRIRRGSQLFPVPYIIHHDARWHPDPERFDPERFTPERFDQLPSCAWIPFGAGPRACIGAAFATMEMVLIVATVVQRVRLSLAPGQGDPEPLPLFSLRPRGGLRMTAAPRAPAPSPAAPW
jgi:cytochrome P450